MNRYHVYIMASESKTLYVGVTGNLEVRVDQHRQRISGFTAKYNVTRLVHFEETDDVSSAIAREKRIKGWTRAKKIALIESVSPEWEDLAANWFAEDD
jgi:putative endonuclease